MNTKKEKQVSNKVHDDKEDTMTFIESNLYSDSTVHLLNNTVTPEEILVEHPSKLLTVSSFNIFYKTYCHTYFFR